MDVVYTKDWTRADLPPPIPAFSWQGSLAPHVVIASALPLVAAIVLPSDALTRFSALAAIVEPVAARYPALQATANATTYPQVALTVYLTMIAAFLVVALHFFVTSLFVNYRVARMRLRVLRPLTPVQLLGLGVGGPVLAVLSMAVFVGMPGDPSIADGLTTSSRLGLGVMSMLLAWVCGLSLGAAPSALCLSIDAILNKNKT